MHERHAVGNEIRVSSPEESLRRQLRFSMFLQGFAALLFGGTFLLRAFTFGWDLLTVMFAVLMLLAVGALILTSRKTRQLDR